MSHSAHGPAEGGGCQLLVGGAGESEVRQSCQLEDWGEVQDAAGVVQMEVAEAGQEGQVESDSKGDRHTLVQHNL